MNPTHTHQTETTITLPTDASDRGGHPAPPPGLAMQYFPVVPFLLLLLGVFALGGDILFGKSLFDHAANQSEAGSWVIAISVTLASTLGAIAAGNHLRHGKRTGFRVFAALWLATGLTIAGLRGSLSVLTDDPETLAGDLVVAAAMFAVYLVAGADIIVQASKLADRRYLSLWGSRFELRQASRRLATIEAEAARTDEVLARLARDRERLDDEVRVENEELDAMGGTLKQRARLRVALHLGDPSATSLYRADTWPQSTHVTASSEVV